MNNVCFLSSVNIMSPTVLLSSAAMHAIYTIENITIWFNMRGFTVDCLSKQLRCDMLSNPGKKVKYVGNGSFRS